jgi:hypothetical protein
VIVYFLYDFVYTFTCLSLIVSHRAYLDVCNIVHEKSLILSSHKELSKKFVTLARILSLIADLLLSTPQFFFSFI